MFIRVSLEPDRSPLFTALRLIICIYIIYIYIYIYVYIYIFIYLGVCNMCLVIYVFVPFGFSKLCGPLFMYGFYHHFNNLRFNNWLNVNDFPLSIFKCFSLSQVNLRDVGCRNDRQPTLWPLSSCSRFHAQRTRSGALGPQGSSPIAPLPFPCLPTPSPYKLIHYHKT